jgi:hypothetical protein
MWKDELSDLQDFTKNFLEPFRQTAQLELHSDVQGQSYSPWIITGSEIFPLHIINVAM